MRTHIAVFVLFFAALFGVPQTQAREASFQVGAQVVSGRAVAPLLQSLPRPAGSRPMATTAAGAHHAFPGAVAEARDFYRQAMPAAGYALLSEQGSTDTSLQQVWSDGERRVVVVLDGAHGTVPATRISLQAGAETPWLAAR